METQEKKDKYDMETIVDYFTQEYEKKGELFINEARIIDFLEKVRKNVLVVNVWGHNKKVSISYEYPDYKSIEGTPEKIKVEMQKLLELAAKDGVWFIGKDYRALIHKYQIVAPSEKEKDECLEAYRIHVGKPHLTPKLVSYTESDHLQTLVRQLMK